MSACSRLAQVRVPTPLRALPILAMFMWGEKPLGYGHRIGTDGQKKVQLFPSAARDAAKIMYENCAKHGIVDTSPLLEMTIRGNAITVKPKHGSALSPVMTLDAAAADSSEPGSQFRDAEGFPLTMSDEDMAKEAAAFPSLTLDATEEEMPSLLPSLIDNAARSSAAAAARCTEIRSAARRVLAATSSDDGNLSTPCPQYSNVFDEGDSENDNNMPIKKQEEDTPTKTLCALPAQSQEEETQLETQLEEDPPTKTLCALPAHSQEEETQLETQLKTVTKGLALKPTGRMTGTFATGLAQRSQKSKNQSPVAVAAKRQRASIAVRSPARLEAAAPAAVVIDSDSEDEKRDA